MPTLEENRLVFRFPMIEPDAAFSINLQRTLRIPDTERTYALPPGLGAFPLRHVEDFAGTLPEETQQRGGVFLPMWQAEAMWLSFNNVGPHADLPFPVAIKVAAGKINAVSGEPWQRGMCSDPQDYLVSPEQPWLDGFAVEKGVIRQFVAMPLGRGYTAEEQLTGKAEWGGLQIMVIPLKKSVWNHYRQEHEERRTRRNSVLLNSHDSFYDAASDPIASPSACYSLAAPPARNRVRAMGLGGGGRMRQSIYPDHYPPGAWDMDAADRVFITLVHAMNWHTITGEPVPTEPPTAEAYSRRGLPWFEYYGNDQEAIAGAGKFAGMASVATLFKAKTATSLPNSADIDVKETISIGPSRARPVNSSVDLDR